VRSAHGQGLFVWTESRIESRGLKVESPKVERAVLV